MRRFSAAAVATFLVLVIWLSAPRPAAAQSWPMFQGNPAHTGYLPVSLAPGQFNVRWTKNLGTIPGGAFPVNPVAAGDGRVYATLQGYSNDAQLFALRTSDGATLWTRAFANRPKVNPPSYVTGRVYLQTGNHSADSWLWALDGSSGTTIFQSPVSEQWPRHYAPTVFNGRVYINGGYYGGMYGFNGTNGDQLWFTELQHYDEWTPAVDATRAYAYVGEGLPGLYIKKLLDGTDSAPGFIPDPDFEWDGWSMNLAPVLGAHGVLAIHDGRLISFNPTAGTIGWQLKESFTGQPSVAGGRIYAVNNGGLSVYDEASHTLLWSWAPPSGAITQPMIVTDTHVLASTRNTVYAIDRTTHDSPWTFAAPDGYGQLAIADGKLFVATYDGTLTAISLTSSAKPTSISPNTGPSIGGTPVTITGSGFQVGAVVRLGGIPATISSLTSSSISLVTGPHVAGAVDVEVENPDGDVGRLFDAFTYDCGGAVPTAAVSGGGTVCAGQGATLSVALAGTGPWSLVWSDGVTQSGLASSPATRVVTPPSTTTYTVLAVADTICAGAATGSAAVTVNPTPSATLNVPTRVCAGRTTTASVPPMSGATYVWTVTNATILSGQGTNVLSFVGISDPVTIAVDATLGTCGASDSRTIPFAFSPSGSVSGGGTICAGGSTDISFNLTGTAPFSITWSDGFIQPVSAAGPGTRTVSPTATRSYTITALHDGASCPAGTGTGSATVTVNPLPSVGISAPASFCAGAAGLTASVPDAGTGATYAWTIAGGTFGGSTTAPVVSFTPTGPAVTLGVTVGLPTTCSASSSRVVSLAPPPSAVVSGGGSICSGNEGTIQVALTGTPPYSLTWSDGVVQSGIASPSAQRSVRPAATTTYSVTNVQDANCSGAASGSATFNVVASPSAVMTSANTTICPGGSATLTVRLSGQGPYTLTWSDGFVETVTGPERTRAVSPAATRKYTIGSIRNATCSVPGVGSTLVTVFPDPSASAITAPAEVCAEAAGMTASVPDSGAGTTYTWSISNGTIDAGQGTRSISWTPGQAGTAALAVSIRVAAGCEVSGSVRVPVNARPALPVISAPSGIESGATGVVAEVIGGTGPGWSWSIVNGTITSGAGTSRITFSTGDPGVVVLDVIEKNAKGCDSPAGHLEIPVKGLTATRLAPIVLDVAGPGGQRYTTELVLSNPSPSPVRVDFQYTAASSLGAAGSGTTFEVLAAGRQRIIPDVLAWLRDKGLPVPSDGSPQGGALRVTFDGVAAGWTPSASTRTTIASGAGRAGLSIPAVEPDTANASKVWLFGLRETAADRSNVALVNAGVEGSIDLRVSLYSGEGASIPRHVLPTVRLAVGQWLQLNTVLRTAGFASGYALVERIAGTAPFHAYAVFNDNLTNDGSAVPATPVNRIPGPQVVPVVVETGSFNSELVLANPGIKAIRARLWFTESLANPGGYSMGGVTIDLAPGEQKILPGILAELRRRGLVIVPANRDYAGTLAVTFSAGGEAADGWAGARTATAGEGAGRYGLFCASQSTNASTNDVWLFGLIQNAEARTNLALVNAAANLGAVTLRYSVYDGVTGTKVGTSEPVTLGPGAWTQLNAVLSKWKVENGYLRIERVEGTAPFLAYAVVNDGGIPGKGTGDGSFVEMSTNTP